MESEALRHRMAQTEPSRSRNFRYTLTRLGGKRERARGDGRRRGGACSVDESLATVLRRWRDISFRPWDRPLCPNQHAISRRFVRSFFRPRTLNRKLDDTRERHEAASPHDRAGGRQMARRQLFRECRKGPHRLAASSSDVVSLDAMERLRAAKESSGSGARQTEESAAAAARHVGHAGRRARLWSRTPRWRSARQNAY